MKAILLGLILALAGSGCTSMDANLKNDIDTRVGQMNQLATSQAVTIVETPYLKTKEVRFDQAAQLLNSPVKLLVRGNLADCCNALSSLDEIATQFFVEQDPEVSAPTRPLHIDYEGSLKNLLNTLSAKTDMAWRLEKGQIIFSPFQTTTYTVAVPAGDVLHRSTITNVSKDSSSLTSIGGGGGDSGEMQTSQQATFKLESDALKEITETVRSLLTKQGTVTANTTSGTLTVRDTYAKMRAIDQVVRDFNAKVSRQVALSVKVYSLELNDEHSLGVNLTGVFKDAGLQIAGGLPMDSGTGQITAMLTKKHWDNASATLEALQSLGSVSLLTSGSGITANNQPYPLQSVRKDAYLASVSTSTNSDYGQTTTINPGEITQGFSMTVIPHILENRKVMLQYNLSIVSLDGMESYENADIRIELPKVSTKSFSQRATLNMGETLILSAFTQEGQTKNNGLGFFSFSTSATSKKSMIVITIDVEDLGVPQIYTEEPDGTGREV